MNKAAINIHVHVFWWTHVFIFLDKHVGVELLDHRVDVCLKKNPTEGHKETLRGDRCPLP